MLYHKLVLYEDTMQPSPKRPVVRETYNEIVFIEPAQEMIEMLPEHLQSDEYQNEVS